MAARIQHFAADGATIITQQNWPDAFAGANQTPLKFGLQNVGDRPLGITGVTVSVQVVVSGNDGVTQLRLATDSATLPGPWNVLATAQAGTGSFASGGTKGYKVTSLSAIGESTPAMEATVALSGTSNVVALSWQLIPTATGYKVYRTDTPGVYGPTSLLTQIGSGAQVSMNDGGGPLSTGTPPLDNRTAGWLTSLVLSAAGAGGIWGSTGTRFYRVVALDSTGVILAASLENSVFVDVVTKTVTVSWVTVPGAATYQVYRSNVSGVYTTPALLATGIVGTSFVDAGGATTAGQLTQAASFGIPPLLAVFGTSPLVPATSLAINQTVFYWADRFIPVATPEVGNPRLAQVVVQEL